MRQLLDLPQRTSAVFAVSDKAALGALDAIREAGLQVPKRLMGHVAVRLLADQLTGTGSGPVVPVHATKIVVPVTCDPTAPLAVAATAGVSGGCFG